MLLAIDPGANSGWAIFENDCLSRCGLGWHTVGNIDPDSTVIECEQLRGRGEKNPNSILLMARNAGEWCGRYHRSSPEYIRVADWKGSTPKDISHRRIFRVLTAPELGALVLGCKGLHPRSAPINEAIAKGLTESDTRGNILDAIGVGLFAVGRKA